MSKLILMCGVPGSGKSTWIQNNKSEADLWVSRDKIRFNKLKEGDDYFAYEDEVFEQFLEEITLGLEMDKTVFADATHLNRKSRAKVLNRVHKFADEVEAIVMDVDLETAIERNNNRTGLALVPPSAIGNMYRHLDKPQLREGKFVYSRICIVDADGKIVEERSR